MLDLVLNWIVPIVVIAAMIGFTHTHPDRVRGGLDSGETAGAPPMDDASA